MGTEREEMERETTGEDMAKRTDDGSNAAVGEERWWSKGWNVVLKIKEKIKEWLEDVVVPRWKNFIRQFNKNQVGGGGGGGGSCGGGGGVGLNNKGKFQYDPLSYALNFDEGPGQSDEPDNDRLYRDFSCRYASIPISAMSSMDLGRDGPSFSLR
ncbi:uncharacterized protein LOC122074777 [Macadamia integrifolia]|uniref:uncharacterized protein LOC122074777 n=1 Tax=Macadamia integrifolia TaxID=60698 RepID=UPI001C4FD8C2|nr:uncharacterized protein LOC122074777 [Macadamia integrifolia]